MVGGSSARMAGMGEEEGGGGRSNHDCMFSDVEEDVERIISCNKHVDLLLAWTCFFLMLYMYRSTLGTGVPRS